MLVSVPVYFADIDGLPEFAGRLDVMGVVAEMLADGMLKMEPVYMQVGEQERRLMEIRLVMIGEGEKKTARRVR